MVYSCIENDYPLTLVSKTICVHKLFMSSEGTNERSEFAIIWYQFSEEIDKSHFKN